MTPDQRMKAYCSWLIGASVSNNLDEARLSCLDTFGCMLAGLDHPVTSMVRNCGLTVATSAGVAAHVHDFDDNELIGSTHPSSVILAALVGLNARVPLSYGQVLDGYTAGFSAIRSIGSMMGYEHYAAGWHATTTIGIFGAAVACGRALALNEEQLGAALSFAMGRSAGLKAQFGTDAKAVQVGQAAEGGLQAALLARAGLRGNPNSWTIFARLHDAGNTGASGDQSMTLDIQPGEISRKPWPCCQYSHRSLDAILRLDADPGRIEKITIAMPEVFLRNVSNLDPQSPNEAKFSLVWCAAKLLLDRKLDLESFTQAQLGRTELRALAAKVELVPQETAENIGDLNPDYPETVTAFLTNGEQFRQTCAHVPGGAENPVTRQALIAKFRDCATFSGQNHTDPNVFLDTDSKTSFATFQAQIHLENAFA